jgi:hypothetical protein
MSTLGCKCANTMRSMPSRIGFLVLLLSITSIAKAEQVDGYSNVVTTTATSLCERPDGAHCKKVASTTRSLDIGEGVYIREARDGWGRIDGYAAGGDVWIPIKNTAAMQEFKAIFSWSKPGYVEANAGDSNISYVFHRNGTYTYTAFSVDGKKSIRRGRLHRHKNILWAKDTGHPELGILTNEIFFITAQGKVCPQIYLAGYDDGPGYAGCEKGTKLRP